MKEALVQLLTLLLALARTPTDQKESIEAQKAKLQEQRDTIDTMHGDSELAEPEVTDLLDDLTEVVATSEPDEEYAEVPEEEVEGEAEEDAAAAKAAAKKAKAKKASVAAEEEEEEEEAEPEEEEEEEEAEETPREKIKRLAAEKVARLAKRK